MTFISKSFSQPQKTKVKLERELCNINTESVLKSWDIGTQTDFHLQVSQS